ncbi:PREDICTED: vasculin isoform X2 [Merops nubicus]|uniref:vasculin isoform X2 n=1 Tax=Merops nubicus TaxID=57421 RepID=UPI0004F0676D|nr:PREDICTED: vasculin isoform X2 [Merops nubicus]
MAQHDFAPAWLNFPTPQSRKSSLDSAKHPENFLWAGSYYEANRRRHNSSDGLGPSNRQPNGGHSWRKENTGWRCQGRSGTEDLGHPGGCHRGGFRLCASTYRCGRGQGLHENNGPEKMRDKEEPRQFEAEDFPSLNPEYEREANQNKSSAGGVWDYPLHTKPTSPRMLAMKTSSSKGLQTARFPVSGSLPSQPVRNGTATSIYRTLFPKPVTPPAKSTQWKSQAKGSKCGNPFPLKSAYGVRNFSPFKSTAKAINVSQKSVKECHRSNSSSPVDKAEQPRLVKSSRIRTDKKSEFLKALKQDRVEEKHGDENDAGQEKNDESFNLYNSNSPHHERDVNQNFENEIPQEKCSDSVTSQQIIPSSAFSQADVLSSSLEAEHRLLKEMGWQEDNENDEAYAPLTEEEMREFQVITEQFKKNGLRKNGILKNGLIRDFKFNPWKNSTFKPPLENEDSETSSSDTSDDDDV